MESDFNIPSSSTVTGDPESVPEPLDIHWPQPDHDIEMHQLNLEVDTNDGLSGINGCRIVDLKHVIQWAFDLERHRSACDSSKIEFVHEKKDGLLSELEFVCSMCNKTWKYKTSESNEINTSFVWATVTAGSFYTQAAQIMSIMDIPIMSPQKFKKIEKKLGKVWSEHLTEEIAKAGDQERAIAIEKGNVSPDGVPFTTVYVDGGWLKRSYGHNFDSSSGMV